MNPQIWIAAKIARCRHDKTPLNPGEPTWEIGGIFTTEDSAVELCTDCRWFVLPWKLDQIFPDGSSEPLPGQYWPCCNHVVQPGGK